AVERAGRDDPREADDVVPVERDEQHVPLAQRLAQALARASGRDAVAPEERRLGHEPRQRAEVRVARASDPHRRCGSSASRRPSPSRLKPSTATMIARPGNTARCVANSRYCRPSFSMTPQDGAGGCAERPRNDSAPSVSTAHESARLTCTTSVDIRFGRMWRTTIRVEVAPTARAASTKSRALSASTGPRTTRAKIGVYTTAMAMMTL